MSKMPNFNEKNEFDNEFTIRPTKNAQNILINNNFDNYFMKTNNNDNNITFQMNNSKKSNNWILDNHIKKIIQETLNKNRFKNDKKKLNANNLYKFSPDNNYWEKREIINKERFEKIKQEREQKMYGNVYPIPKINKNSKEIIRRLREKLNEKTVEEDQIEDQINRNIPIRTQQSHAFFRKDLNFSYIDNKRSNNKLKNNKRRLKTNNINKNNYIIDFKNSYVNLIKLKNNKKTKTPKPKKSKNETAIFKIRNEKIPDINNNNLEKIIRLRKSQNEERIRQFQENKKLIESSFNNNSLVTQNFNFTSQIKNNKTLNISKGNLDIERENKKGNKNSCLSNKIPSLTLEKEYNNLISSKKQSKILNNISNTQSSSNYFNSKTDACKKIKDFYLKQNNTQIFSNLNKMAPPYKKIKKIKKKRNCNIYNLNMGNMRYVHYTENNHFLNKSNINNNPSLKYINSFIKDNSFYNNHNNQFYKVNNNSIFTNYSNSFLGNYQSIYSLNGTINNKINNFNSYFFEKSKDKNYFYDKNYKTINYKNNQINNEFDKNNYIENKSNDNIYDKLDNENLYKFRYENEKKLKELNRNISKNNKKLPTNKKKQIEESKEYFNNNLNDNIFARMDNKKIKNILNNQNKKIKNNLDFFNKEYEINQMKKKMLLEQTFGNPYLYNNLASNNSFSYNNRYLANNNNNSKNIIVHNIKYNYGNGFQKEGVCKGENFDIFGSFNFQRKYKF